MKDSEINDVYNKVEKLFKIKLKAQIKGSEIVFTKLLNVENMVSGQKYYVLFLDNDGIHFENQTELLNGLKKYANKEWVNIKKEIEDYQYYLITDLVAGKQFIGYQLDGLGFRESKLIKIINQIDKHLQSNA